MNTFIAVASTVFPLIFSANLIMALVKALAAQAATTLWLRVVLGVISILGVIAVASVNGTPVDLNSITNIAEMLGQAIIVGVGAHFSYKAISA